MDYNNRIRKQQRFYNAVIFDRIKRQPPYLLIHKIRPLYGLGNQNFNK